MTSSTSKALSLTTGALLAVGLLGGCRGETFHKPPIHPVLDMDFQLKLKAQSESTFPGWTDHRGMRLPMAGTVARGSHVPAGITPGEDRYYMPATDQIFAAYDVDRSGNLDHLEVKELPIRRAAVFALADRNGDDRLDPGEVTAIAAIFVFRKPDGSYVDQNPLPATREVLERGRERFDIHCAACHGRAGRGGLVARRWPSTGVPSLVDHKDASTRARLIGLPHGELFQTITKGKGMMPGYASQIDVEDRWAIAHYLKALQNHFN